MGKIHVLSTHTINQIAAGEVVERPASVVKELVENAMDAGASAITVEIREGGVSYIRITDNGSGIARDDVKTAFLRHATSKIEDARDLLGITTLGFRGEALSSIAAVSQTSLLTRTGDEETGTTLTIHGGDMVDSGETALPVGTTLVVQNLFYNVPARRKFLKKPAAESAAVGELMNRLALGHPEVSFQYINNGNTVLHTPGDGDLRTVAMQVYGRAAAEKLLPVAGEKNGYAVSGLVGRPELCRANRGYETLFLNGRYVRSPLAARAVEAAYKNRLMVGRFPVFALELTVPADRVDVNVHPAKLEVRFREEDAVYDLLFGAVKKTLDSTVMTAAGSLGKNEPEPEPATPVLTKKPEDSPAETPSGERVEVSAPEMTAASVSDLLRRAETAGAGAGLPPEPRETEAAERPAVSHPLGGPLRPEREETAGERTSSGFGPGSSAIDRLLDKGKGPRQTLRVEQARLAMDGPEQETGRKGNFFRNYRLVGRVFETYWIVEQDEAMYLIDQHAAHERILFERFCKVFREGSSVSQPLLQPLTVDLSPAEKQTMADEAEALEQWGFAAEETPAGARLSAVPYLFQNPADASFFVELLDRLAEEKLAHPEEARWLTVATMACKAAVKARDRMSEGEARELIQNLLALPDPFHCPHGRPTIVEIGRRDVEKQFKRIV